LPAGIPKLIDAIGTTNKPFRGSVMAIRDILKDVFALRAGREDLAAECQEGSLASINAVAESIVELSKDAPDLREKTATEDFTKEAREKRKEKEGIIKTGLDGLGLESANAETLKQMLLTKYMYGLLFIGQKAPQDGQAGARPSGPRGRPRRVLRDSRERRYRRGQRDSGIRHARQVAAQRAVVQA
jgi:hypothetical protein